ncbi:MAG: hypothetical protein H8E28_14265 [Anaerolineae bacterium]|nr:hypothetical protein [Anaerolineae bacterium]
MKYHQLRINVYLSIVILIGLLFVAACKSTSKQIVHTPVPSSTATTILTTQAPTFPPPLTQTIIVPTNTPSPAVLAEASRIAFDGEDGSLCIIKPDGSAKQCFSTAIESDLQYENRNITWSPKGTHVAFLNGYHLMVTHLDSGVSQQIYQDQGNDNSTEGRIVAGPVWNPDGTILAVIIGREVYMFPIDAQKFYRMETDAWEFVSAYDSAANLGWSPDGRNLLYLRGGSDATELDGVAASSLRGSGETRLLLPGAINYAISMDQSQLAYRLKNGGIMITDANCLNENSPIDCTSASRALVAPEDEPGGGLWDLRWSPDGKKILAQFYGSQYLIDVESGEIEMISQRSSYQTWPWSPDGKQLVLAHQTDGGMENSQPYIFDLASREETSLEGLGQFAKYSFFAWGFIAQAP